MPDALKDRFAELVARGMSSATGTDVRASEVEPLVGIPPDAKLGDYAFPTFSLAARLGCNPKQLADAASAATPPSDEFAIRAAGPYVNARVSSAALAREVLAGIRSAAAAGRPYAASPVGEGRTVVIEYSSPNIAKPFGIGHLRSTVIGNALVNLYRAGGYSVVRLNYPGDWGTQFGLLMTAWRKWGDEGELASPAGGVAYLGDLYRRANAEAGANPEFAAEARAAFKRLEEGDAESRALWRRFRDLSLAEFQRVYDLLGVSFDSLDGEAATAPLIESAVSELERRGMLAESEGAGVVHLDMGEVPPAMIRKTDGATTYHARDLAALLDRHARHAFDRMIYVVGRDQELHFRQLFRIVELMGLDWARRCAHVPFGMIRFGGEKMRTRAGGTVLLADVLEGAFAQVGKIVSTRQKDVGLDADEQDAMSRKVAVGAVVFADLSRKRIKDFDFDWETAFSLDGDSGPYLMYAHARACGIMEKIGREATDDVEFGLLDTTPERELLKSLGRYPDAVARAREENEPSVLGSHVLEIGKALNLFYNQCRVKDVERPVQDARLLLVWAARAVLAEALGMLGIAAPWSM